MCVSSQESISNETIKKKTVDLITTIHYNNGPEESSVNFFVSLLSCYPSLNKYCHLSSFALMIPQYK